MSTSLERRSPEAPRRRYPIGAESLPGGGVAFRVWAPAAGQVDLCLQGAGGAERRVPMWAEAGGYHSLFLPEIGAGQLYTLSLDGQVPGCADPASRFQPDGPHGPSQVIDPFAYRWQDASWTGVQKDQAVVYEMHFGTFTRQGTYAAAMEQLPELARLGITVVEIMPVAEFPGRFGWGYDGVNLFAPTRLYGRPDDLRRFVDRAHQVGLGVILDVVFNHLGPDGNVLPHFSEDYFSKVHVTEWGQAINFDGPGAEAVREYFITNAIYWIEEFHLDGLRLDATQDIYDDSPGEHILGAIAREVRQAAPERSLLLIAENEPQQATLVRPAAEGGCGLDAMWNDDFHHTAMVRLTGRKEAYYSDYLGTPQEFLSALKYGFLYQGQWYSWQRKPRGTPARDLPPWQLVHFIQNHDQVANTAQGQRAHTWASPGQFKAMTALLLLGPQTPMLFQGQEFAASAPFFYFADHIPELAEKIDQGRREFLKQFPSIARPEVLRRIPAAGDEETFARCKLDFSERQSHGDIYALHRELLRMRREEPVFRLGGIDGAVLAEEALVVRYFGEDPRGGDDRLLIVNFGRDIDLAPMPEPLLAPPAGGRWKVYWSSEDVRYGGSGNPPLDDKGTWHLPGQAALVLRPVPADGQPPDRANRQPAMAEYP